MNEICACHIQYLTIISNPRWPYTLFTSFHIIVISYIQESDVNIYTFYTFCIIQLIAWMIGGVDRYLSTPFLHLFWLYLHLFRPVLADNGCISGCFRREKESNLAVWRQSVAENCKKKWFRNVKNTDWHLEKRRNCAIFVPDKKTFHFRTLYEHEQPSCRNTSRKGGNAVFSAGKRR